MELHDQAATTVEIVAIIVRIVLTSAARLARHGRRWPLVHGVAVAITPIAAYRGAALLQGREAAVSPVPRVLGAPWIGNLGAARVGTGHEAEEGQRRNRRNRPHRESPAPNPDALTPGRLACSWRSSRKAEHVGRISVSVVRHSAAKRRTH